MNECGVCVHMWPYVRTCGHTCTNVYICTCEFPEMFPLFAKQTLGRGSGILEATLCVPCLTPGTLTCHFLDTWQEKELKDAVSVYNDKSKAKSDLVGKLLEV